MILYFRHGDGRISTRELSEAAGVRLRLSPPAGATLIDEHVALAELAEHERIRRTKREVTNEQAAERRLGVYAELLELGLSPASAGLLSGHRPAEGSA
jgi:hypothetical protein